MSVTGLEKKLLISFFSSITNKYSKTLPNEVLQLEEFDDLMSGLGLGDMDSCLMGSVQSLLINKSGSGDGVSV